MCNFIFNAANTIFRHLKIRPNFFRYFCIKLLIINFNYINIELKDIINLLKYTDIRVCYHYFFSY